MPRRRDEAPTMSMFEEPLPVMARFYLCRPCVNPKGCKSHQTCLAERERLSPETRQRQATELQRQSRRADMVKRRIRTGVWDGSE